MDDWCRAGGDCGWLAVRRGREVGVGGGVGDDQARERRAVGRVCLGGVELASDRVQKEDHKEDKTGGGGRRPRGHEPLRTATSLVEKNEREKETHKRLVL